MTEIYLDNSASTRPLPSAVQAIIETMTSGFGNPSSHHGRGQAARRAVDEARSRTAAFLGVAEEHVVFTSGATEANDAVLRSAFADIRNRLVTTAAEHPSIRGVFARAPNRVVEVPLGRDGLINLVELEATLRREAPTLLAIGWVNGETGVAQPVREICTLASAAGAQVLIDAAQAVGRLPQKAFPVACDYLTMSAHKMNGPQGVGCLVLGSGVPIPDMAMGGGQEEGRRSGTENVPGIVGFGVACQDRASTLDKDLRRIAGLRDTFEARLMACIPGLRVNGLGAHRVATNTSITFPGVDGMALVARLDAAGVRCSQVSACSSGRPEPSRTLLAMGLSEEEAFATIRFSLSVMSTSSEVEAAAEIIAREALVLRRLLGEVA